MLCLDNISAVLIEQLLKFPRGLARGRCPPSPVRMRALVRKAILVLLGITSCGCSLSLYQLIDFSTGWKLPCKLCFTQWTFVCLFFFLLEIPKLGTEAPAWPRFSRDLLSFSGFMQWAYSTQQAAKLTPVSIFIVGTKTAMGSHGL